MRLISITGVLLLLTASAGLGSATPGSHVTTHWRATVATLPANAASGANQLVSLSSISCASPGNCSAVGWYIDSGGYQQGLLLTEHAGHWTRGVEAGVPADAGTDPQVNLIAVSCASPGNCTAVGTYEDRKTGYSDVATSGLLLTETAGRWAPGIEAALPANVNQDPGVTLESVSCASAGNCTAVGRYNPYPYQSSEGLLLTERAGHWARGVAYGGTDADLVSVSCAADGRCGAVGFANQHQGDRNGGPGGQNVLLLTKKKGKWRNESWKFQWPDGGPGEYAGLASVSCATGGYCGVIGFDNIAIDRAGDGEGALFTRKAGKWLGVRADPPKQARSPYWGSYVALAGISCPSPGDCVAAGTYYGRRGRAHLTLLTQAAGKWQRGVEASLPRSVSPDATAISCSSPGNCAVAGLGFVLVEIGGHLSRGAVAPHFPGSVDSVVSVSCTSPTSCGAVGDDGTSGVLLDFAAQ